MGKQKMLTAKRFWLIAIFISFTHGMETLHAQASFDRVSEKFQCLSALATLVPPIIQSKQEDTKLVAMGRDVFIETTLDNGEKVNSTFNLSLYKNLYALEDVLGPKVEGIIKVRVKGKAEPIFVKCTHTPVIGRGKNMDMNPQGSSSCNVTDASSAEASMKRIAQSYIARGGIRSPSKFPEQNQVFVGYTGSEAHTINANDQSPKFDEISFFSGRSNVPSAEKGPLTIRPNAHSSRNLFANNGAKINENGLELLGKPTPDITPINLMFQSKAIKKFRSTPGSYTLSPSGANGRPTIMFKNSVSDVPTPIRTDIDLKIFEDSLNSELQNKSRNLTAMGLNLDELSDLTYNNLNHCSHSSIQELLPEDFKSMLRKRLSRGKRKGTAPSTTKQ